MATPLVVGSANRVTKGIPVFGVYTEYEYSIAFAPVTLAPGTPYWFDVSNAPSVGIRYIEAANFNAFLPSAFRTTGSNGKWVPFTVETLAKQLSNDGTGVPEPATIALLGVGSAGLAWRRPKH